jgi:hypothetical protein
MKKALLVAVAAIVPALLFLNAWQGYRYSRLADEVAALESRQRELLAANRDAIAAIARERSADTVERRALQLGLVTADPSQVTEVSVDPSGQGAGR